MLTNVGHGLRWLMARVGAPGRLAMTSLMLLTLGVTMLIVMSLVQVLEPGSEAETVQVRGMGSVRIQPANPIDWVGEAAVALGTVGLLVGGAWQLYRMSGGGGDWRLGGGREHEAASRVAAGLREGRSRDEVRAALVADGIEPSLVVAALRLGWSRGAPCPRCQASTRNLEFLKEQLEESWYQCPECGWAGDARAAPRSTSNP
ncbi:MAG: hypothetical protein QOF51_1722 [Chloroflexota bacterium]|jgi:hypothetical protein|nr:hypothetical protein [Chloroflexota bacterium]